MDRAALSGGVGQDTATITVNLTDVAEHLHIPDNQVFSIAENSGNGSAVGTVAVTGVMPPLTWQILGGNTGGAFAINGAGQLTVANAAMLVFEATPTFTLTVAVANNGIPALSDTATITINLTNVNEAPVVENQTFAVPENAPNGTVVATVSFIDPDAVGQTHAWQIIGGNTGGAFAISAAGQITVANSAALDFDTNPTFTLTVQVLDNGTPNLADTAVVTINVTNVNVAPNINNQTFSIAENSANGSAVGTVALTDPDVGQTHAWQITAGNTNGAFAINSAGQITVANRSALNFEATPSFTLTRSGHRQRHARPVGHGDHHGQSDRPR